MEMGQDGEGRTLPIGAINALHLDITVYLLILDLKMLNKK